MKIAFVSDFHLGFSQKGRESDAFEQAKNALELAVAEKPDAIVFTGDFFHKEIPAQETLLEAFQALSIPFSAETYSCAIEKISRKGNEKINAKGIPFIAIHGTHEFRGRDFTNVLEVLESAGFCIYVHAGTVLLEKHREKAAFHGLGGVPEKKALDALRAFNPKPVENAYNVLLLHQSFKEFLPFEDEMVATLSLSDLPAGFDLAVNGHLHWNSEFSQEGTHLIMPGSTVVTQMKNLESKKKKGFFLLDTKTGKLEFRELKSQRPFYYKKIELEKATPETASWAVDAALNKLPAGEKKPLVRLKFAGSIAKGFNEKDLGFSEKEEQFSDKAILSISSSLEKESFKKKMLELSELQKQKKPLSELGLELLEKNLEEAGFENAFDVRRVFSLLKENELEKAMDIVSEPKQTKQ